ncbi:MAG TPA: hypothetical protein VFT35_05900 [Gaiellaceae bacterium]|jgi:hypothetical protein|nr:hypothetical protein [Gaiellaceae bacterium]
MNQMTTAKAATIIARNITAATTTKPTSSTDAIVKIVVTGAPFRWNPMSVSADRAPDIGGNY